MWPESSPHHQEVVTCEWLQKSIMKSIINTNNRTKPTRVRAAVSQGQWPRAEGYGILYLVLFSYYNVPIPWGFFSYSLCSYFLSKSIQASVRSKTLSRLWSVLFLHPGPYGRFIFWNMELVNKTYMSKCKHQCRWGSEVNVDHVLDQFWQYIKDIVQNLCWFM